MTLTKKRATKSPTSTIGVPAEIRPWHLPNTSHKCHLPQYHIVAPTLMRTSNSQQNTSCHKQRQQFLLQHFLCRHVHYPSSQITPQTEGPYIDAHHIFLELLRCPLQLYLYSPYAFVAWKATRLPLPLPINSPSPSAQMNVDTDNPHMRQVLWAGPGRLQRDEEKQHARLQASPSATSMILLQCPQQKFEIIKVFYSPTDAQVNCLKTILKFTLKQLRNVFKAIHLCISWWIKNFDSIKMRDMTSKNLKVTIVVKSTTTI